MNEPSPTPSKTESESSLLIDSLRIDGVMQHNVLYTCVYTIK